MTLNVPILLGLLACSLAGSTSCLIVQPDDARVFRRSSRPLERLNEEIVPTHEFKWIGGVSNVWEEPRNWDRPAGVKSYPGHDSDEDVVIFNNRAMGDCELRTNRTVKRLELRADFPADRKLEVMQGHALIVRGGLGGGFRMWGGKLNLSSDATLNLSGGFLTTTHQYGGGDLNSEGGIGRVYVYGGATLNFIRDGTKLGASLCIGKDRGGNDSDGFVRFAREKSELNVHVTLYNNVNIFNYKRGTIHFNQSRDSDTKGGIETTGGSTSRIENFGRMNRLVKDTKYLKVVPPVMGLHADSVLHVGGGCLIEFVNHYTLEAGTFKKDSETSHARGLIQNPGR
jgi:hypothetical protein